MKRWIAAATCAAAAGGATIGQAQDRHYIHRLFQDEPCGAVVNQIDTPDPTMEGIGNMAMAFGYLMGFEGQFPNARGDQPTLLIRFREICQKSETLTGLAILNSLRP